MTDTSYLADAATAAQLQAAQLPGAAIPVDPDVADFMGAFTEDAIGVDDMLDDALLASTEEGEVLYGND